MELRGKLALGVLIAVLAASLFLPLFSPYGPNDIDLDHIKMPPGAEHPLGTDQKGRDVLTRILYGGRISIGVAVVAAFVSMFLGLGVGLFSGYAGGRVDTAVMSVVDLILAFPSLLLAIGVSVVLPPGTLTVMLAIAAVGWASFARLIRSHVLTVREAEFVLAARAMGAGTVRVLLKHIAPQCIPLALVMTGLKLGGYIITEASLSFLGLGAQPPTASWGSMVGASRSYMIAAPWMVLFPGLAIAITALSFNILGDALKDPGTPASSDR